MIYCRGKITALPVAGIQVMFLKDANVNFFVLILPPAAIHPTLLDQGIRITLP